MSGDESIECNLDGISWRNVTQFADLNDDCMFLILDQLDFVSLINLAGANQQFSNLASDVYRRKYASKKIEIVSSDDGHIKEGKDIIQIEDKQIAMKLLQRFGRIVSFLKIDYWENNFDESKHIIALANKYCDTLVDLEIISCDLTGLADVQRPFHSVKKVSLERALVNLTGKTFKLNEMFPNIHTLILPHEHVVDREGIAMEFPHLKKLVVSFWHMYGFKETDIEPLIKRNPQIESLTINSSTLKFIQFISGNMPNLKHLKLHWIKDCRNITRNISLRNVQSLDLKTANDNFLKIVEFQSLEELDVEFTGTMTKHFFGNVNKYTKLRILNIKSTELNDTELITLVRIFPNLVDGSFIASENLAAETVIHILKNSSTLQRLRLNSHLCKNITIDHLVDEMDKELSGMWKTTNGTRECIFEKNI